MKMPNVSNLLYLCNYDDKTIHSDDENLTKLWSGDWSIEDADLFKELLASILNTGELTNLIKKISCEKQNKILHLSISIFLTFCDRNWNAHPEEFDLELYLGSKWPKHIDVVQELQRDSEPVDINIQHPELLYFSTKLFSALLSTNQNLITLWWCFRSRVAHQRALEDCSSSLYAELELLTAKLSNEVQHLVDAPRLQVLLYLELAQAYLMYSRIQNVEEYLIKARDLAGLKLELTGVLGKRTKYQQTILPQLALTSELTDMDRPSAEESHGSSDIPPEVELDDDVRLNKIQYMVDINQADLPSLEQTLCLLTVQYILKSQPKDDLMIEQLQPYIAAILAQKTGPWSTRVAALLVRCRLEATHKRTVERAMQQCETIVNDKTGAKNTARLSYLWASGVAPAWTWRRQLADLYLSLGLVKAALAQYECLRLWEDVVVCHTLLQHRHKAADVIREQLEIKPTVKLYCLLGDATDDVSLYEKAWEFSKHKSSRAQRHWGNFLFEHKDYAGCVPHYEASLHINSIQEGVWLRLAFAALSTENWEVSARAYRRYTYLQPHTFEAWNNLAKCYVQLGDKGRAYRALLEALRYNYDNWKLWENVILISMDTGHFEDVIRGCHRLLDLRQGYDDLPVLRLLARVVIEDRTDAEGNGAARLRKRVLELFGRITSVHQNNPEIWQLYCDLSPTYLLKAQRLLKAYKGYTQNGNWPNDPDTCAKVMSLAESLLDYSLLARQDGDEKERLQADQQLSSARLTGQAVLRAAEKQAWPETAERLEALKAKVQNVTDYMKSLL